MTIGFVLYCEIEMGICIVLRSVSAISTERTWKEGDIIVELISLIEKKGQKDWYILPGSCLLQPDRIEKAVLGSLWQHQKW